MLGRRESQGDFFRPDHAYRDHVGEQSFFGLLARHGADWFRDEDFVALYREDFGRPSVPPSQLAIALLLQAHDSVSDEEAIARSAFDLRWKVALGLELEEKLCAKCTLQRFRAQLVLHESTGQIFDRGIEACREAGLLKRATLSAAIDTTPILGRGAVRDTYNLVSDGIRHAVDEACRLKDWDRDGVVEAEGLSRHYAASFKGSLDLDWSDAEERRAVVGQLVADARVTLTLATRALRGYAKNAEPTQSLREARRLLAQLLAQDIDEEPEDGGGPSIRRGTAKDRIVSTTDPEMRHGHKSHSKGFEGYKAAIVAETESGSSWPPTCERATCTIAKGPPIWSRKRWRVRGRTSKRCSGTPRMGIWRPANRSRRWAPKSSRKRRPVRARGCSTALISASPRIGQWRAARPANDRFAALRFRVAIPAGDTSFLERIAVRVSYALSARRVVRRPAFCRLRRRPRRCGVCANNRRRSDSGSATARESWSSTGSVGWLSSAFGKQDTSEGPKPDSKLPW